MATHAPLDVLTPNGATAVNGDASANGHGNGLVADLSLAEFIPGDNIAMFYIIVCALSLPEWWGELLKYARQRSVHENAVDYACSSVRR